MVELSIFIYLEIMRQSEGKKISTVSIFKMLGLVLALHGVETTYNILHKHSVIFKFSFLKKFIRALVCT